MFWIFAEDLRIDLLSLPPRIKVQISAFLKLFSASTTEEPLNGPEGILAFLFIFFALSPGNEIVNNLLGANMFAT